MDIDFCSRPKEPVSTEILGIVRELTGPWFSPDVEGATAKDMLFDDLFVCRMDGRILSFIMFSSYDGMIQIKLMGTRPSQRRKGYGMRLMSELQDHAIRLKFDELMALTVPPESNSAYQDTVDFYVKCGFAVVKKYTELWRSGALEFRKKL